MIEDTWIDTVVVLHISYFLRACEALFLFAMFGFNDLAHRCPSDKCLASCV